jgi:hypothetical protein
MTPRVQASKPKSGECNKIEGYCTTHKQGSVACQQMIHGNLCHKCLEWHTGECRDLRTVNY